MAKRIALLIALLAIVLAKDGSVAAANAPQGEWIILVGGVSLNQWEKYKAQPHDHWWATSCMRPAFGPSNYASSLDRT